MADIHVLSGNPCCSVSCRMMLPTQDTAPTEKTKKSRTFVFKFIWTFQTTMSGTDRRQKSMVMWMTLYTTPHWIICLRLKHCAGSGSFPAVTRSKAAATGRH